MQNIFWYGIQNKKNPKPDKEIFADPIPEIYKASAPDNSAAAGQFPSNGEFNLSAVNITQGRVNALETTTKIDDHLQIILGFKSMSQGVFNFKPTLNIEALEQNIKITEIEKGVVDNHQIVFNQFSLGPPFLKQYRFFVQFKKCTEEKESLEITAKNTSLSIPISCK